VFPNAPFSSTEWGAPCPAIVLPVLTLWVKGCQVPFESLDWLTPGHLRACEEVWLVEQIARRLVYETREGTSQRIVVALVAINFGQHQITRFCDEHVSTHYERQNYMITTVYPSREGTLDMSQEKVEQILCFVERIRPEEITSPEQWEHVGPYSFAEVRLAIAQKAVECTGRKVLEDNYGLTYEAEKQLHPGEVAYLYVQYPLGVRSESESLPEQIVFETLEGHDRDRCYVLEVTVSILEPNDGDLETLDSDTFFADFRRNPPAIVAFSDIQRTCAQEHMEHMWAGIRCLCRNLRTWGSPGIVPPEEI
jgi:hypothetical protein